MIDHDNDGFIDKDDLKDMLASLGIDSSEITLTNQVKRQRTNTLRI